MTIIRDAMHAWAHRSQKKFTVDRAQTVGASEIGQCARKVWYLKNEADQSHGIRRDPLYVESWGARVRGTIFEDFFWVPAMQVRYGEKLLYSGMDQTTFVSGFLSATPDGMLVDMAHGELPIETDCAMVECKTVDPRTNLTEAKDENVYQTQVQMGLVRECTPHKPTHSIISYTDASWWNDVKEYVVAFDPIVFETAKMRALEVMTSDAADQLKPEGWIAGGRECNHCPFTAICGIERRSLPFADQPVDPQFAAEIADMARRLKHFEEAGKDCETQVREIQDEIKTRLREKGVRKIPGVVSWSNVKGRAGYDTKALREAAIEAGIDVEQFATEGTPGDRLVISIASPGADEPLPDKQAAKRKAS